jgi:hypothetical protein
LEPSAAGHAGADRKKLNDLGRAWAGAQGGTKNELKSDLDAWGITIPERYKTPERIVVWPENATAFDVFRDCASQWRYLTPPMGNPIPMGIERTQLESTMRMLEVDDMRGTLRKIQHIEAGALEVMRR